MRYLPLSDNAARQLIDSCTVWDAYLQARAKAAPYAGGMYWKKEGAYEYLVKTKGRNRQERVGPRDPRTERIYEEFHTRKADTESRVSSLSAEVTQAQRLNKALKVGRTPEVVVDILNSVREAGLEEHFYVVGTNALYAYETAAGVRMDSGVMATLDIDLLWDARRRVQFSHDLARDAGSVLQVLQRADASFRNKGEGEAQVAINDKGFEVEFLRRAHIDGDPHPFRFSADEEDLWPVQAARAGLLAQAPVFSHPVASATGRMARMRTIDPKVFAFYKHWLGTKASGRDPLKRRRDVAQAQVVQMLLAEGFLVSTAPDPVL